jgi:alpha-galactosidase
MSGDIQANWNSVVSITGQEVPIANISAPGGWNDMDMLEVGVKNGMTNTEYTSHFSIWAAMKAPLILGNDVTNMTSDIKNIIANKEVIAINQDPLGASVLQRWVKGNTQLFSGPLSNNAYVALFLNVGNTTATMSATWSDIFNSTKVNARKSIPVRDLWEHKDLGPSKGKISVSVEPHGVRLLKLSGRA